MSEQHHIDAEQLAGQIRQWGRELGLSQIGFADTHLEAQGRELGRWLMRGHHGEMHYMAEHGSKRWRPAELVPGTLRIISARMNYLVDGTEPEQALADPDRAYVARYALGRDYHKLLRKRLARLAKRIEQAIGPFGYRVFVDSAPVLEVSLAEKAGLGWPGKHTLLLNRDAGSWFFLGEIYTDLPLPTNGSEANHCGRCTACIDDCPTGAIIGPHEVDARRCISYLTIELHGAIPVELRPLMGNRIYGCDDCQLVCPWNSFAEYTSEPDFAPRNGLDSAELIALFAWEEAEFLRRLEGSPIRRIGHQRWLRNIAVALGNALRARPGDRQIIEALRDRLAHPSELVREHVDWALAQADT